MAPIVEGKRVRVLTIVAPIILLSFILPTWDVTSDGLLILEFFNGDFATCLSRTIDPRERPCPLDNCKIWDGCIYRRQNNTESCGYCKKHPSVCDSHINFGFMLLGKMFGFISCIKATFAVPFLLSYFKSFYTWWSEASNKKLTFILPLLNLYPQYGKLDLW